MDEITWKTFYCKNYEYGDMSEEDYPYTAENGPICKYDATKKKADISEYTRVYADFMSTDQLAESLFEFGPQSGPDGLQNCPPKSIDF